METKTAKVDNEKVEAPDAGRAEECTCGDYWHNPLDHDAFCPVGELAYLKREFELSGLGDRPQSMSADKLRRLLELEGRQQRAAFDTRARAKMAAASIVAKLRQETRCYINPSKESELVDIIVEEMEK